MTRYEENKTLLRRLNLTIKEARQYWQHLAKNKDHHDIDIDDIQDAYEEYQSLKLVAKNISITLRKLNLVALPNKR